MVILPPKLPAIQSILAYGRDIMAPEKSEKKEYKNEDYAKRQQKQWEKKGFKVTRRKNVLYLKKG